MGNVSAIRGQRKNRTPLKHMIRKDVAENKFKISRAQSRRSIVAHSVGQPTQKNNPALVASLKA